MQGTNNDIFLLVKKLLVNAKSPNGTNRKLFVAAEGALAAVAKALSPEDVVVVVLGRRPEGLISRDYPRLAQVPVHQV